MKIVFFGEDSFSAVVFNSLLKSEHQVSAVFCPKYNNLAHARLQRLAKDNAIPFYRVDDINSVYVQDLIKELNPDLISINHFQKLLKTNILEIPKKGCINLHPSLLPSYRGLSPIQQPIIHGEKETGVTVHFVDEGIDTGDIILQKKITITSTMYVAELQRQLFKIYESIVPEAIGRIDTRLNGHKVQKHLPGSYFGKLKLKDCYINLEEGYEKAMNLVRGVSRPYFGARIEDYCIWSAYIATTNEHKAIKDKYSNNGIYFDETLGVFITFSDGSLLVKKYDKLKQ
ncbi:MAG: methionyl-tRNA formyltransferase [Flavobacteriaceae bacterium]|nr:methionyl-tRNA formyltransferase [Flavobacteriaceae bacterium]